MAEEDIPADDTEKPSLPRYSLRGWMGKLTARRWAVLFVFEFFVVLLGVLAAQGLAEFLAQRRERDRAGELKAALDADVDIVTRDAIVRARTSDCFHLRLERIREDIELGRPLSENIYAPPGSSFVPVDWNADAGTLIRKYYGEEAAGEYARLSFLADRSRELAQDEQTAWTGFTRLTGQFGPVTEEDRRASRDFWMIAERSNHQLQTFAMAIIERANALEIDPDVEQLDEFRDQEDSCIAALGYSMDEHRAAREDNRLVTGEETNVYQWRPTPRADGT